jgi:hypothetical protein
LSWHQRFFDPIELPNGRKLVTLRDAADYIMKLPKAKQQSPDWQAATEALIMAAGGSGTADACAHWNAEDIEPTHRTGV